MEPASTGLIKKNQPENGKKETFKICLLNTSKILAFAHQGRMADHLKS